MTQPLLGLCTETEVDVTPINQELNGKIQMAIRQVFKIVMKDVNIMLMNKALRVVLLSLELNLVPINLKKLLLLPQVNRIVIGKLVNIVKNMSMMWISIHMSLLNLHSFMNQIIIKLPIILLVIQHFNLKASFCFSIVKQLIQTLVNPFTMFLCQ